MIPEKIKTKNLKLVTVQHKDATTLFKIWSDPLVTKFMDIDSFERIEQAEEMIAFFEESLADEKAVRYAIFYEENGIGSCGFNFFDWQAGETEIGYELAKDFWYKGFGTEVVTVLCDMAFEKMDLKKIHAYVEKENFASQKLLLKQGFKETEITEAGLIHYIKLRNQ